MLQIQKEQLKANLGTISNQQFIIKSRDFIMENVTIFTMNINNKMQLHYILLKLIESIIKKINCQNICKISYLPSSNSGCTSNT